MNDSARRKSNQELPGERELREILEREAPREVSEAKLGRHYVNFDVVRNLSDALSLPDSWLDSPEDEDIVVRATKILQAGDKWVQSISERIAEAGTAVLNAVYDYLAEQDEPELVDFLVVLGGKSLSRPQKTAELYKQGSAKKVVVTGSRPNYMASEQPEWQIYRDELISQGVGEKDILLEKEAITVPDCAFRTLNLLDGEGSYRSLGVVTTDWNLRRAHAHFMKMSPPDTKVLRFGAGTLPQSSRDEWFKTEKQSRIILNEFVKMRVAQELNVA